MSGSNSLTKIALGTAIAAAAWSTGASAATCGITGSSTAQTAVYDPFNPSGFATTRIVLNLTRVNTSGGGDTRVVNFYLRGQNVGANGTRIVPISVAGSVSATFVPNGNIFYNYSGPFPTVSPTSQTPTSAMPFLQINFTGNNAGSDTAQVTFDVTLPANLDVNAGSSLSFDAYFGCNIQGGRDNGLEQSGNFNNAVTFPIRTLSALRAYYAGTALDFGEIGEVSTASLAVTPRRTDPTNSVRVQSSAAYSVALTSANGYRLKRPGAATANDEVQYSLKFLGQNRSPSNTSSISATCVRAGVGTSNEKALYLQGSLVEGGEGKNPSATYRDVLSVTITPLADTAPATTQCESFSVP